MKKKKQKKKNNRIGAKKNRTKFQPNKILSSCKIEKFMRIKRETKKTGQMCGEI